jgi:hypothetical protein
MEPTEIRFGDERQRDSALEGTTTGARSGAAVTKENPEPQSPVVGLFHDPLDGAASRSLPTSTLRVDARGYSR